MSNPILQAVESLQGFDAIPPRRMIYLLSRQHLFCSRNVEYDEMIIKEKEEINRTTEMLIEFLETITNIPLQA